ncbi:MAG: O-antigen ligase family protein [Myxococcota bacterium]|nr:O-antigen ligase family protein [Myxococcota bacterium]
MPTTTLPPRARARVRVPAVADIARTKTIAIIVGLVVVHIVLAVAMRNFRIVGLVHALGCVSAGLIYAATTRHIRNVSVVIAYLVGCEVLWRMTKVSPFWEFGKYASLLILLIALARIKWSRNRALAFGYFGLLLPSVALTVMSIPLSEARGHLSFNLSGPLLMTVAVLFFSNIRLTIELLRATFFALIIPTAGIALLCYLQTSSARVEFFNASNDHASGGFGANQVSAVLGLATMFLLFLTFERRLSWRIRIPLLVVAITLATQAILTFARGGVALAFAGLCTALFFMLRGNPRARVSIVVIGIMSALLGKYVIEPRLDDYTGGKLSKRYSNTESTGRDAFAAAELDMFTENPVFGVGPGVGFYYRAEREVRQGASHTEYTRMLGEHGLFGVLSLACLVLLGLRAAHGPKEVDARAHASAFVVWAALFLAIYGTRIAAPAFVFGLAFAIRSALPAKSRPAMPAKTRA